MSAVLSAPSPAAARIFAFLASLLLSLAAMTSFALADPVAGGTWEKKSFRINGSWEIVEQDGQLVLNLDEEFKTRGAPDLKLFLSPAPLSSLNGNNATNGAVLIAPLQSRRGAQSYVLPAGVDLAAFQTLIIHCEAYSKLWGGSAL